MDLEAIRQANIRQNQERLKALGIWTKPADGPPKPARAIVKKPARRESVIRASARIAANPAKPTYRLEVTDEAQRRPSKSTTTRSGRISKAPKPVQIIPRTKQEKAVKVVPDQQLVDIQAGWTAWKATGARPVRDDDMRFHFEDQPEFQPNKSPEEMLREGCFGGGYFRPLYSQYLRTTIRNDYKELPSKWYEGLDVARFLTSEDYNVDVNKYKVSCGQTIEEWEAQGWIQHQFDVRGWFQWYCRFFQGRRCDDDERQVSRWRKCVGPRGRWRRMLLKKYVSMGVREVFDDGEDENQQDVSPTMHQTCFHWAYEIRQSDLDLFWATGE